MIKLAVNGALGKMGQRIIALAEADSGFEVLCAIDTALESGSRAAGPVMVTGDFSKLQKCGCLIDFSSPAGTLESIKQARGCRVPVVIGTTGHSPGERIQIEDAANDIAVVFSPNMSIGVNIFFRAIKQASCGLKGYKVSVEEAHHIHKKDAPSGTAKKIVQIVNDSGFSVNDEDVKAVREGEIVGDHRVIFESQVDKLEFYHSAKTRDIFAQGAIEAARWVVGKPAGLYSMEDVLFSG